MCMIASLRDAKSRLGVIPPPLHSHRRMLASSTRQRRTLAASSPPDEQMPVCCSLPGSSSPSESTEEGVRKLVLLPHFPCRRLLTEAASLPSAPLTLREKMNYSLWVCCSPQRACALLLLLLLLSSATLSLTLSLTQRTERSFTVRGLCPVQLSLSHGASAVSPLF